MDINFTKEDIAFRDEVREWLANDYPKHVKEKTDNGIALTRQDMVCLLYTSPSPRDTRSSRMPSSA